MIGNLQLEFENRDSGRFWIAIVKLELSPSNLSEKTMATRPSSRTKNKNKFVDPSAATQQFMSLVKRFSYRQGPRIQSVGLTNFTFFAGAGFSKSWDPKAPTGSELFTLKPDLIERVADSGALERNPIILYRPDNHSI